MEGSPEPGRSRWARGLALAVQAALLLGMVGLGAGCGSTKSRTVDAAQVEQGIETSLSTSSVKVTHATCPNDVPVQAGATFTCTVSLSNGGTGKVTVTQQAAGRYTYAFTPGSVEIPGTAAATSIEKQLAAQGAPDAKVTCPETIIVKVDSPVTCNVSGGQGAAAGTVTFEFSEANGSVSPTSVKT